MPISPAGEGNPLVGFSTDVKPTDQPVGSTFYELDTRIESIWNGTEWVGRPSGLFAELDMIGGKITGLGSVNKFGRSTNVDSGVATDIWDRANAVDLQAICLAPSQARIHNIVSSSAFDDGDPVGVGARTIRVDGLTDWDTPEVSEVVTLNGVNNVQTVNQYVIIHRMEVLTNGLLSINVGVITATAVTDDTVTAQINAGKGQTQMAILGVPSVQDAYMIQYYASFNKTGGSTGAVDMTLLVNQNPDSELRNFVVKHTQAPISTGDSASPHRFDPKFQIPGPAIIKIQCLGSASNLDVSAGFDLILRTK